jgi:hypothetical protein
VNIAEALKETAQISAMSITVSYGKTFEVKVDTKNQVTVLAKDINGHQRNRSNNIESVLALFLKDTADACLIGQLPSDHDRMFMVTIDKQGNVTVTSNEQI